jgi:DNA-binding transcriptional ArsR family regulator
MLNQQDSMSILMAALADPTRRAIVERLAQRTHSVSELAAPFEMSLAAVVQHINVLEDAGAVTSRKQGRVRVCKLNMAALATIGAWISERQRFWEEQFDDLDAMLDRLPEGVVPRRKPK